MIFWVASVLFACNKTADLNPIPASASTTITIASPAVNTTFPMIQKIDVNAEITDGKGLESIQVFLTEMDGNRRAQITTVHLPVNSTVTNYSLKKQLAYPNIHLPKNKASATYMVTIEAKGIGKNMVSKSATFAVQAPLLSKTAFTNAFRSVNIFEAMNDGWYLNPFENGKEVEELMFSNSLFFLVASVSKSAITENVWREFVKDFNLKNQVWEAWDVDKDGTLNDNEFYLGITNLNLFDAWDADKNALISESEMAGGLFESWDHDNNNVLSRNEYEDKSYTYIIGKV